MIKEPTLTYTAHTVVFPNCVICVTVAAGIGLPSLKARPLCAVCPRMKTRQANTASNVDTILLITAESFQSTLCDCLRLIFIMHKKDLGFLSFAESDCRKLQ